MSKFKPRDKVRCIDASLSSHQLKCGDVYQVFEPEGDFHVSIYGTVGSWEIDRFEKVDKPESVTNGAPWDKPEYESPANKYARRLRSVPLIVTDVYEILDVYGVHCPAVQHAVKKLLCAGQRGVKSRLQDLKEAKAAIERAIEMEERR